MGRELPDRPSLRYLKLEAKRRVADGEFPALHTAHARIAHEHGVPSWAALKHLVEPETGDHALTQLRWIVSRFRDADAPGWQAPDEGEMRQHFDEALLGVVPPDVLAKRIAERSADLRADLVVVARGDLGVRARLAGWEIFATAEQAPPHRLNGLRLLPLAERITDQRIANPPVRTVGSVPRYAAEAAAWAFTELGMAGLVVAGAETGGSWTVAMGWADLDDGTELTVENVFPVYGGAALVTATAVLRLIAEGRLDLGAVANDVLRTVRLADDSVTVRDLLVHIAGVENPPELFAERVPPIAELYGPVVGCDASRGQVRPSNGGFEVLGQIVAGITGMPYPVAASRLVLEPLDMEASSFPAKVADIGASAVTGYEVGPEGRLVALPTRVCTLPAVGGLWATPGDALRLATGWSSLLPPDLACQALTPQERHMGLGWLLLPLGGRRSGSGRLTAVHAGIGPGAACWLQVAGDRTHVVLASRFAPLDGLAQRLVLFSLKREVTMYQAYRGGDRQPETERKPSSAPPSVRTAVRLMYAGAVASLIGVVIGLTQGVSKSAIHKAAPKLTPTQVNTAASLAVVTVVVAGLIGVALWLVIARASARGRNWARVTGTVFFGIQTLSLVFGLARPEAAAVKIYPVLVWLIGLGAVIFLWRRESSEYFS